MKNKLYIIEGKTYLDHINDEVHLYGLLHQLAFLAGRIKDEEDVFHVLDTAKRYGEIAEEKFQGWDIPGRYLVFGDPKDLKGLMDKELDEVEVVPAEEPAPKKYKDEYIIPGSGFRMLVGDLPYAGGRHPPPDRPLLFAGPPPVRGGNGEGLPPPEEKGRRL